VRNQSSGSELLAQFARKLRERAGRWALLAAAVAFFALPGLAANETFVRTYPLNSGGSFLLENVNGSVRVLGWEREEVEVRAVKSSFRNARDLDRVQIDVVSQPGRVAVRTLYPEGQGVEVAVEYVVHVPYRVLLGNVQTVNGSVLVRDVEGEGDLRSVNGNVEVLDSSGRFSARTTNGDLRLELRHLLDGGPMKVETVNGSVFLGLPSNASADLRVLSMNGDFVSELPVVPRASTPASRVFRARLGEGGGPISVRTINGGIRLIRERPMV
jgi:Putative adhesin